MVPFYRWIFAKSLKLKLSLLRLLTFDVCCRSLWLYTPKPPCLWSPLAFLGQVNWTHHIHIFVLKMQFWYLTFSSILKCLEFKGFFMQILHEHFQIRITYEFLSTSLCMQIHVLGKWRRPTRIRSIRKSTINICEYMYDFVFDIKTMMNSLWNYNANEEEEETVQTFDKCKCVTYSKTTP